MAPWKRMAERQIIQLTCTSCLGCYVSRSGSWRDTTWSGISREGRACVEGRGTAESGIEGQTRRHVSNGGRLVFTIPTHAANACVNSATFAGCCCAGHGAEGDDLFDNTYYVLTATRVRRRFLERCP